MGRSRRRKRRWLAVIGLGVLMLLGTAYAYLRVEWEGADLGDNLASMLNKRMRGRISIGSIEWQPRALKTLVTGGWVPITVHDVKVWDDCALSSELGPLDEGRLGDPNEDCTLDHRPDPDPTSKRRPRKLLIDAPEIDAEIDVHAALFGNHDLFFRKVVVHGGKVLLEQTHEPYPLHAYDRTIVSVLTAFYPRMKAGFRAGIYADGTPPQFDLRDVRIEHLDVTVQFGEYKNDNGTIGYVLAGHIEDVNIDLTPEGNPETYLHMNATDPLVPKFYVRLQLSGKHSTLRIFDDGKRETFVMPGGLNAEWAAGRSAKYVVDLSEIKINRLAQLPDQWGKRDYVANNLEMDISAHTIPCKVAGVAGNPADGADIHLTGQLLEWWDRPYDGKWDLALAVKNFGPTLRTCIKSNLGGDNLYGTIKLSGPFIADPKVSLDLHGLDFDIPLSSTEEPVRLTLADVDGDIDLVNEQGSIQKTKALIRGGKEPGEVMVSATFGLKPLYSVADIDITNPIDIGRFLPPRAVASVGKFLSGKLRVRGDVIEGFALENFDLALGRTPEERAIRVYSGRIFTKNSFNWINIENVQFQAGRSRATINGAIEYVEKSGEFFYRGLRIVGDYPDLSMWLERFGLPPIVSSASGGGEIVLDGPVKNPQINVKVMLAGLPCIDTLRIDNATIKDGILDARMSTSGLGGNLSGTVRADISGPMKVIQRMELTGSKVEAAKLCGLKGAVKGTIDNVKIAITEPTTIDKTKPVNDWLGSMTLSATAPKLNILGENFSRVAIRVNKDLLKAIPGWLTTRLDPDDITQCEDASRRGGFCALVEATRDLGGKLGTVIADVPAQKQGRVTLARRLGGTVALDDIPLAMLQPFIGKGVMGGLISTTLHLGGNAQAPSVEIGSTINLTRAWIGGAYIGDTQLGVIPTTFGNVDAVRIYGPLMAGALYLDGVVGTAGTYPVYLELGGRRVEVGPFVDLTKKLKLPEELQVWGTGKVTVQTELKPLNGKPPQPEAWVELDAVQAILNHRTRDGRRMPIRFEMVPRSGQEKALSLRVTPSTLELACRNPYVQYGRQPCPARLVTPAGVVEISGGATANQMQISALGQSLDLRRLAPLFENQLEDISGTLELNAKVSGTFDKPTYEASLDVKDLVSVRLPGGDSVLQILGPRTVDGEKQPGAQIKLANGTVGFGSFTLNVKDERKDEQGELHVSGSIALSGLKPASWGLLIEGKIAGKMLSALAPDKIAQGGGLARIDAALSGKGALPQINATLTFDPEEGTRAQPLSLFPRGVRREIALLGGSIEIKTDEVGGSHRRYTLDFRDNPITATIDNEGRLTNVRGELVLVDGKLDRADVALDAERIPFRKAQVLDLNLSARNISLRLPSADSAWQARGNIAIVDGAYRRNFDFTDAIKPKPETVAPAKPFWDEFPSIGNADLDLELEVRRFAVDNNLAKIDLAGPRLYITGSPRDPRISGAIRVQSGEFKLPGVRARFLRTFGSIDFAENMKATNPSLDITSIAPDFVDLSGQAHTITLTISGSLEQAQIPWDLRTSTGYDKSQTFNLLLGFQPSKLRRSLGDQAIGTDPTKAETSTNPGGGVGDQLVKDIAGDYLSGLLGGSLTRITGFDVLRFEVGFGSVGVHAEKKMLENLRAIGDYEQTVRGSTINARGEFRTPIPDLSVQAGYLNKNFDDPSEIDIDDLSGKIVFRLFIP